jgi:hypothetical protein
MFGPGGQATSFVNDFTGFLRRLFHALGLTLILGLTITRALNAVSLSTTRAYHRTRNSLGTFVVRHQ